MNCVTCGKRIGYDIFTPAYGSLDRPLCFTHSGGQSPSLPVVDDVFPGFTPAKAHLVHRPHKFRPEVPLVPAVAIDSTSHVWIRHSLIGSHAFQCASCGEWTDRFYNPTADPPRNAKCPKK